MALAIRSRSGADVSAVFTTGVGDVRPWGRGVVGGESDMTTPAPILA